MKFTRQMTIGFGLGAALCSMSAFAQTSVNVAPFKGVELRGGGHVLLRHGNEQRVTLIRGSTEFTRFRIKDRDTLLIDTCNNDCPHRYDLDVEIVTPRIDSVAIDGGGKVESEGGFDRQATIAVAVDGGGAIDIRSIDTGDATAAVNGGGSIRLKASRSLEAAVDGGGNIAYWGNPQVSSAINGGGSVHRGD